MTQMPFQNWTPSEQTGGQKPLGRSAWERTRERESEQPRGGDFAFALSEYPPLPFPFWLHTQEEGGRPHCAPRITRSTRAPSLVNPLWALLWGVPAWLAAAGGLSPAAAPQRRALFSSCSLGIQQASLGPSHTHPWNPMNPTNHRAPPEAKGRRAAGGAAAGRQAGSKQHTRRRQEEDQQPRRRRRRRQQQQQSSSKKERAGSSKARLIP